MSDADFIVNAVNNIPDDCFPINDKYILGKLLAMGLLKEVVKDLQKGR